jgi:hypothetical protein
MERQHAVDGLVDRQVGRIQEHGVVGRLER